MPAPTHPLACPAAPSQAYSYAREAVALAPQASTGAAAQHAHAHTHTNSSGKGGGGSPARLRDFHPALVGYALAGRADNAGQVVADMLAHCEPGDLTGVCVCVLLLLCAACICAWCACVRCGRGLLTAIVGEARSHTHSKAARRHHMRTCATRTHAHARRV
jgi:hypothetical protein